MATSSTLVKLLLLLLASCSCHQQALGQLTASFYNSSCPTVESVVKQALQSAMNQDTRIGASLLRLHFHDCFVNGCDASILLDDTPSFTGEKTAVPNNNSARGYDVVDNIKSQVEQACPGTVSCADILAIAARDAVVLAGGPSWTVQLGRRDSTSASQSAANSNIPAPTSTFAQLVAAFQNVGLSAQDLVALSGAHTIGRARCATFSDRLYNFNSSGQPDPRIASSYLSTLQQTCPNGGNADAITAVDPVTQDAFDNQYYQNVLNSQATLNSDAELTSSSLVNSFSNSQSSFFSSFGASMVNMGNLSPLTGTQGEIRSNCKRAN